MPYGETRYVIHAARAGGNIVIKNARLVFENETTARGKDGRGEWRKTIDGRILEAI